MIWNKEKGPVYSVTTSLGPLFSHSKLQLNYRAIICDAPCHVDRNVVLWGAEGAIGAGAPRSWSPLSLLTGCSAWVSLHSYGSSYTTLGPLLWCISNVTPHTCNSSQCTKKCQKASRLIHFQLYWNNVTLYECRCLGQSPLNVFWAIIRDSL